MSACKDVNWRFRPMALDVSEPDDQANLLASGMRILVGVLGHAHRELGAERHQLTACLIADAAYKDSATPANVTSLFLCSLLTRNGSLETSAGRKARHSCGSDLQFLACLWIASSTSGTLGRFESAKPNEGHRITFRYRFDDGGEDGIKRPSGSSLADVCFGCRGFDQFSLIHESPLG